MDESGGAQRTSAPTVLPADLEDRARRNRAGVGSDPTANPIYPGSQPPAAVAPPPAAPPPAPAPVPPTPPPAAQPPAPPPTAAALTPPPPAAPPPAAPAPATTERPAKPDEMPLARKPDEKPTEHVLRLANDVRVLTYAIAYMRKQLTKAIEASTRASNAKAAAEAQLANAQGSAQAHAHLALLDARADLERLAQEAEQLRRAIEGARREAEQWSDQARNAELRLKYGMDAARQQITALTEQATALEAAVNQLRQTTNDQRNELEAARKERDVAHQRIAELEAELVKQQSRHPRGNIAALASHAKQGGPTPPQPSAAEPPAFVVRTLPTPISADIYDEHPVSLAASIDLDEWQRDAVAAWGEAGHCGVIEAVTSTGNPRLAYWAIGRALDADMKALVLAPTTERVDRWYEGLTKALPNNRIGKHSGRGNNRLAAYDVVVATAQAAAKERVFEPGLGVLVVADEVHEFGTEELSKALDHSYPWRLGLTSSYERDDDGVAMYLDRYFGHTVFQLGYARALGEQVVASFDVAMVPVLFSSAEQAEYDACARATFAAGGGGKAAVRAYLKAVSRRDELLAGTTARDGVLRLLATAIRDSGRALVVAPTPHVADAVAKVLAERGCTPTHRWSAYDGESRQRRGGKVEDDRDVWQLFSPREATEQGDPANVDLAIMVNPPRSRRQLIERMDRALGSGRGGRKVRLVVLYVEGSIEDDMTQVDAAPISIVMSHARRLQRFRARGTDTLLEFLAAGRRVVTLPPDPAVERTQPTQV